MSEESLDEYITAYLNNGLSSEESKVFEQRLNEDESFREEFVARRLIHNQIANHQDIAAFKNTARSVIMSSKKKKKARLIVFSLFIAMLSIYCVFVYFTRFNSTKNSSKDLYALYYEKYPVHTIQRNAEENNLLQEAMVYYAENKYQNAIKILDQNIKSGTSEFYLAMAHLEIQQYKSAQKILENLSSDANPELHDAILWYRALLYLKNKETKKAINLLKELSNTNNEYTKSSKVLLTQLD